MPTISDFILLQKFVLDHSVIPGDKYLVRASQSDSNMRIFLSKLIAFEY